MINSTPENAAPNAECLTFIRTFARLYSPEAGNEREARLAARLTAAAMRTEC